MRNIPSVNVSNVLSRDKREQVIALGRLGWSLRRIEAAVHIRRETIGGYLRAAGIPVRSPGGWGRRSPAKPANEVITDSGAESVIVSFPEPQLSRSRSASVCEQYRELIEVGLSQGRNAKAIWQDLVDSHGFAVGYQSVQRFVGKLRRAAEPEARAVIQTAPGEEAQVDYGSGPMVRDPQTGKYRRTRLFVLTLGYSRKCVRLLVFRSTVRVWAELHEKAFRRLGGATRVVVLDNLREGVLAPDIYDPTLNPLYKDVLQHYAVVALPCRVRDPDRKGKVESSVGHAKKTPLKGLRFESLEEAQAYLDRWEERWADTRIHGTTKRQVAAMFAEERPALLPLPVEPFRYYQYGERTVHLMAAWKSRRLITARHRAGLAVGFTCSGMTHRSGSSIRATGSYSASIYDSSAAGIVSTMKIAEERRRFRRNACYAAPKQPVLTSAHSARSCIAIKGRPQCAAFWACWRS